MSGHVEFRRWCAMRAMAPSPADARGHRLIALASYGAAALNVGFAIIGAIVGGALIPIAITNLVFAAAMVLVPRLKRFGPLVPALTFLAAGTVALIVLTVALGTGAGLLLYFVIMAASAPMVVGTGRLALMLTVLGTSVTALVVLYLTVPTDTGRLPSYLMTGSFVINAVVACVLVFVIVGYGLFEIQRAEEALEEEYERSEALLANILPRSVAQRLKMPDHAEIADAYDDASILVADIVGFTALASRTSPTEVVRFLDRLYTALDGIVERHGLEKIKTTGDAYMVVSGVPEPRPDHLCALARCALDIRDACTALPGADGVAVPMRIGLADGPVIAGVVGSKKFFYDVWGDAVNRASRMESTGVPGRIQVMASVRERLAADFVFVERGIVAVKGLGDQPTWFLEGERSRVTV